MEEENIIPGENPSSTPSEERKSDAQSLTEDYPGLKRPYYLKRYIITGVIFSVLTISIFSFFALRIARRRGTAPVFVGQQQVATSSGQTMEGVDPRSISDPTYYWKTFESPNNLFSFRYPQSWTLSESPLGLSYFDNSATISIISVSKDIFSQATCVTGIQNVDPCRTIATENSIAYLDLGDPNSLVYTAHITSGKELFLKVELQRNTSQDSDAKLTENDKKQFISFLTTFNLER